jgi:ferric-dicitrate binding protein FerR (iron transport regulator)
MNQETLLRYITGDATETEKAEMAQWLDANPENMREFLAFRKLYDITLWQTENKETQLINPSKIEFKVRKLVIEALKVAAIFVVALLGARYFLPSSTESDPVAMQTIYVPAGQRAELTLSDGTKVWLNAKTTFVFPNLFSDKSRNVSLDGEGYFDVKSNKKQPFIVKTEKYDVKVWGTQFNLMAYTGKPAFETSLLEGSVELLYPGGEQGVMIAPNERIYLKNERLVRAPIVNYNHFLWKEGLISFDDESFPEMVTKLELYFDLKINMNNNRILKNRYTGKFRTKDGVEHILKVLQLSNHFKFKIDDKLNIITIE